MQKSVRSVLVALLTAAAVTTASCSNSVEQPSYQGKTTDTTVADETSASRTAPPTPPADGDLPAGECGADVVNDMTTRARLAQLLMVGVTGVDDARSAVENHEVGGIFVGSWTDKSMLTDGSLKQLQRDSPVPLMVSTDQEGGRVSRLSSLGIDLDAPREVVASGTTPDEYREQAKAAGERMAELGITLDFAPVVDVSDESDDEVIGDRSYSNDPEVVTEYAQAFSAGLQDAGIIPVYKHFPGHGHGSGDSHTGTVRTPPLSQLRRSDLVPYRTLLQDPGTAGVMLGHLIVPGLTGDDTPASISPAAHKMLRTGQGYNGPAFDGLVFSDDLSGMAAISDQYPVPQAVLRAIVAGTDVALWITTASLGATIDELEAAVNGQIDGLDLPMTQVNESVVRVLKAKGVVTCG